MSKYRDFLSEIKKDKVKLPKVDGVKKWSKKTNSDGEYVGTSKIKKNGKHKVYYWNPKKPNDGYWDYVDSKGQSEFMKDLMKDIEVRND